MGALVAMGHRAGSVWLPFAEIGAVCCDVRTAACCVILQDRPSRRVMLLWTLVFVWLADRLNRVLPRSLLALPISRVVVRGANDR